jgi:hypothetical protein
MAKALTWIPQSVRSSHLSTAKHKWGAKIGSVSPLMESGALSGVP